MRIIKKLLNKFLTWVCFEVWFEKIYVVGIDNATKKDCECEIKGHYFEGVLFVDEVTLIHQPLTEDN